MKELAIIIKYKGNQAIKNRDINIMILRHYFFINTFQKADNTDTFLSSF